MVLFYCEFIYQCPFNLIDPLFFLFTVRYGDRAPKSIPGRIFGIMWTLTGLVIISILIGAIASSLTTVNVEKEIMLYGREVSHIPSRGVVNTLILMLSNFAGNLHFFFTILMYNFKTASNFCRKKFNLRRLTATSQ